MEARASDQAVLLVFDSEARTESARLQEELTVVGMEVEVRQGKKKDARDALEDSTFSAVVYLDKRGLRYWIRKGKMDGATAVPEVIERDPGESPETHALRSAELVRGSLLSAGTKGENDRRRPPPTGDVARTRLFSVTTGPTLLLRSYGGPSPGWTADAAIWWWRLGIGPYFTGAFLRSDWSATPDPVTFGQVGGGGGIRFLALHTASRSFELVALLRCGVTVLSTRRTTGPEALQFDHKTRLFSGEGGLEGTVALAPWLRAGAQFLGGFDVPGRWTVPARDLPEQAAAENSSGAVPKTQRHLTMSGVITSHF